jgi:hypothetical protein
MFLKSNFKIIFMILYFLTHLACNEKIIETTLIDPLPEGENEEIIEEVDNYAIEPNQPVVNDPLPEEIEDEKVEVDQLNTETEYESLERFTKSQKGPFYIDSDVFIQEMIIENHDFVLSGDLHLVKVIDNLGSFIFPKRLNSSYVDIRVNGYYFNEVTGLPSNSTISLGSYSSLTDNNIPSINILTTLAQKRIRNLIKNEKLSFEEAEAQAKEEVLHIFHIEEEIKNFDELRIEGNSSGDAVLLAISVILQGNLNTAELSNLIAKIREDLSDNGVIDSEEIHDQICGQTRSLDPISIRENLLEFYQLINREEITIPLFEDYLDSDCNGILNKNDSESFIFFNIKVHPGLLNEKKDYSIYPFQNQLWVMGSDLPNLKTSSNFLDFEDFESGDFNHLHSPIMFTLEDNLHLVGGWQILNAPLNDARDFNHSGETPISSLGHYTINSELEINEIVNPYFNHMSDDPETNYRMYEEFLLSGLESVLLYDFFSSDSHELLNYDNKIYLIKKSDRLPSGSSLRSYWYSTVLSPDLEWESDDITDFLERCSDRPSRWGPHPCLNIISFNNEIYVLARESFRVDDEDGFQEEIPEEEIPENVSNPFRPERYRTPFNDERESLRRTPSETLTYRVKLIKYDPLNEETPLTEENIFTIDTEEFHRYEEQYFTLYEDMLIITNSNTSLMTYSNDGETWIDIHHPYRSPAEPGSKQNYISHKPIVFRNMIHLMGGSQNSNPEYNGVVYGYFKYYYDYLREMGLLSE